MKTAVHIALCLLALALPVRAYSQWNLATNLPMQFKFQSCVLEIYDGMSKKCDAAGVARPLKPGAFFTMSTVTNLKIHARDVMLPAYVNHTVTNASGDYYLETPMTNNGTRVDFQMWDGTSACAHAGVYTGYLEQVSAFDWWSTNNLNGLAKVISVCRWTRVAMDKEPGTYVSNDVLEATGVALTIEPCDAGWRDQTNDWFDTLNRSVDKTGNWSDLWELYHASAYEVTNALGQESFNARRAFYMGQVSNLHPSTPIRRREMKPP